MCGIAGFLGDFPGAMLHTLNSRLAHRGPDGRGAWHEAKDGIGLAHGRLSIIDVSEAAAQPMRAVNNRYTIAFNGEIYNYQTLRGRVATYEFNRNSDTAVLCPLYDAHGPAMLDLLEGMFVFALWDSHAQELFVARDHAGIKPLYYAMTPNGLVFASELKALAGVNGIDRSPDVAALADYLTLLWSPGERTPMAGVRKLPPGHYLTAKRGANGTVEMAVTRWYHPPQAPLKDGVPVYDHAKTPADLLVLLDEIVAEQCTSDVPVGAFLSGGVDSSALVASMVANARIGKGPMPEMTYCIGFEGAGMEAEGFSDDLPHAKAVAKKLGVPMTPIVVKPAEVLERLPTLPRLLDEPTADPAPLFVQDICAQARADGMKVLLSGTGGDDVMTGYRRHLTARVRQHLGWGRAGAAALLRAGAPLLSGSRKRRAGRLAGLLAADDETFLMEAFMTNSQKDAWTLLTPEWRTTLGERRNALHMARAESRDQDMVNRLLYMELFGFLPDHNLNYGDKASMASGVEVRVPLTDRRLLNFMADVSPEKKLHGRRLKAFFKDAVSSRLPSGVIHRGKAGFGAPLRGWLTGPGRGLVEDALNDPLAADWLDLNAVRRLWEQTRADQVDGTYTILAVCMLVWWRQAFKV